MRSCLRIAAISTSCCAMLMASWTVSSAAESTSVRDERAATSETAAEAKKEKGEPGEGDDKSQTD
jgi:hypothetical protein